LLVDAFERIRALLRGVSADAGGGESRSGSASRGDSLIEFVKTNVVILPLLIFTATTGSDELSYGLNDTAVDGFWIGSNWESTGEAPLADTLASILDSAPCDGAAARAEEAGVINCKRSWIGRPGATTRPASESPEYRGKYRDDVQR
jgi:hypothetical protein